MCAERRFESPGTMMHFGKTREEFGILGSLGAKSSKPGQGCIGIDARPGDLGRFL